MKRLTALTASVAVVASLGGCGSSDSSPTADATDATSTVTPSSGTSTAPLSSDPESAEVDRDVVGTVVRFTSDRTTVDVTIGEDSPAVRDFLSMLPLELTVEEFSGSEKIAYLPRELDTEDSPGSDPENGHLIYYAPWGNLGFYYDAAGIDYSESTLHIGRFSAGEDRLALLEGDVDVAVHD